MYKFGIRASPNKPEENKKIISFFEKLGYYNKVRFSGIIGNFHGITYVVGDNDNAIHCFTDPIVELLFDNVEEAKEYINKHKEVMNKHKEVINKEIKIDIPEGYEIDKENSTFEHIILKKKELTYQDIGEKLFCTGDGYSTYIDNYGNIKRCKKGPLGATRFNYCTSAKQAEKLLAINKLMNVAKYLNNGWKPNWSDYSEKKYHIRIDNSISDNHKIIVGYNYAINNSLICFKTEKLVREAIRILGEDTIRLIYSTDY